MISLMIKMIRMIQLMIQLIIKNYKSDIINDKNDIEMISLMI